MHRGVLKSFAPHIVGDYSVSKTAKTKNTMNTNRIGSRLKVALKHSALALAATAGLAIGSAQALTTTTVINLGAPGSGTAVTAATPVLKLGLGTFPPGSLLRSVTLNYRLDGGNPYLGDLAPLFADSNGDNGALMIAGDPNDGGYPKTATTQLSWASGEDYSVGVTGTATLTVTEGLPAIDLNNYAVWLQTGWNGTWSGSITLEYDLTPLTVAVSSPSNAQGFASGTSITATAIVWEPGAFTDTVTFHTTPISPAGPTVETVSSDVTSPFSADLGMLPTGSYEIYATVANSDSPPGTATSPTRTFTVAPPTPTTTVLAAAGAPTTYGNNVTFTATVSPTPTGGTVQFWDGANYLGTPVAVNTGTGEASYSSTTLGAGTHVITAEYSGYQIYETSTTVASISHEVGQAPLTVRATNTLRAPNTANPDPLPYQITGYQNGENLGSSGVTGAPLLTTDAVLSSLPGNYTVTCALGTLAAANYSFTLENGTLTVAELVDTFSVNFYSYGNLPAESQPNVLMTEGLPAGLGGWFTSGWSNVLVPWGGGLQPAQVLTSNKGTSTATFTFKDCRNGWQSWGEPRTTNLGDGNYNMMGSGVNSTLDPGDGTQFFDMEMTNIPFAVYDVIFYIRANDGQFGDGTGVIKFNGGADRAFKLKSGAFDGNFIEMVDATTEGNYIVFTGVTGNSFTAQTWGTGTNGFNHLGPAGFQIRESAVATGYSAWATLYAGGPTAPADDDFNNDGVDNGVAFFMGMNGVATNPGVVGNSVTWPYVNAVTSYKVQTSSDLSPTGWTDVLPSDPRLTDTGLGGSVSYNLLPNTPGSLFVRLLVTP
jgi:hypothetical protein